LSAVASFALAAGGVGCSSTPEHSGRPRGKGHILRTEFGKLQIFPPDNPWNQDISKRPVHPKSSVYLRSIGLNKNLHPDFGHLWLGAPHGIPYVVVSGRGKEVPVTFQYAGESDKGPYPIPDDVPIEGGPKGTGDRHAIIIDYSSKTLYELFLLFKTPTGWRAGSGAIFDLTSNRMRPAGWTSADAAGLPVFPGLVRYDEVGVQKEIRHALRFTVSKTQRAYIHPARHYASASRDKRLPPMGLRVRLRADYDVSRFPLSARVILTALKKYGMILADNGGDWFISGAPDRRWLWHRSEIEALKRVKGRHFEVVYTGEAVTH